MTLVVGAGAVVADFVVHVPPGVALDGFPESGAKRAVDVLELDGFRDRARIAFGAESRSIGGPVPIALAVRRHLGDLVRFVGVIGDDPEGEFIEQRLAERSVPAELFTRAACRSHAALVLLEDRGERTLLYSSGSLPEISAEELEPLLRAGLLDGAVMVHLDQRDLGVARLLASAARAEGIPVYVDADAAVDHLAEIIELPTVLQIPLRVAQEFLGVDESLESAAQSLAEFTSAEILAVTDGREGYALRSHARVWVEPAIRVTALDELGAGDAFAGAFGHRLAAGVEPRAAARWASSLAALFCRRRGNAAFPERATVDAHARPGAEP